MRLRRRGRERKALAGRTPPSNPEAESTAEAAERERVLRRALAELPEKEREAFLLIALGGLGSAQAAEALGCSPAAARVYLGRARSALAKKLEGFLLR
jgi:RNA polymerase sigma-70 factor (ECF subfamily)